MRVGGAFSNPAEQYPSVFGKIKFFVDYPYALPTFIVGAIGLSATIISALFVREVGLFLSITPQANTN